MDWACYNLQRQNNRGMKAPTAITTGNIILLVSSLAYGFCTFLSVGSLLFLADLDLFSSSVSSSSSSSTGSWSWPGKTGRSGTSRNQGDLLVLLTCMQHNNNEVLRQGLMLRHNTVGHIPVLVACKCRYSTNKTKATIFIINIYILYYRQLSMRNHSLPSTVPLITYMAFIFGLSLSSWKQKWINIKLIYILVSDALIVHK